MVCSGSEANDLALRIARAATGGATHVAVIDGAYHGHVGSLIDISPYKFNNPGGAGRPSHVHILPTPDVFRGTGLDGRAAARTAIQAAKEAGGRLCAFIAESVMSCAGQVLLLHVLYYGHCWCCLAGSFCYLHVSAGDLSGGLAAGGV